MMMIKTGKEIVSWTRGKSLSQLNTKTYNKKWVTVDDIIVRLNHIREVIRNCSFEDDFGKQCLEYSDLHNLFKNLESELNNKKISKYLLCTKCKKNLKQISWITCDGMRVRTPLCKDCEKLK